MHDLTNLMKTLGWLLAFAWMATIFWLSSSSDAQGGFWLLELIPYGDKVAHAGAYGLLAGFFWLALRRTVLPIVLSTLYGVTDELHQAFVPGRSLDVLDLVADAVGACLFISFIVAVSYLTQRRADTTKTLQ